MPAMARMIMNRLMAPPEVNAVTMSSNTGTGCPGCLVQCISHMKKVITRPPEPRDVRKYNGLYVLDGLPGVALIVSSLCVL
jgi:hypothetical protein